MWNVLSLFTVKREVSTLGKWRQQTWRHCFFGNRKIWECWQRWQTVLVVQEVEEVGKQLVVKAVKEESFS